MKVQFFDPKNLPEPSIAFRNAFDSYLKLCEFKEEEKLGILFYLGAFLPGKMNDMDPNSLKFMQYLQAQSLYSKSTGVFSDYGDLNEGVFKGWIYNANLAISKIIGDESPIDENLRALPIGNNVEISKSYPNNEFLDLFNKDSFSLNAIQNLNDELFIKTGLHLKDNNCSYAHAYEAGFAYRMLMMQMDIKGTDYLLSRINSYLSPLFQSLFHAPILFVLNPKAFKSNHLFSLILNHLYGGNDSPQYSIVQSIHRYHQFIFYKENSIKLKNQWLFNKDTNEGSAMMVFINALNIHKSNFKENVNFIKYSGEVYDSSLIDTKIRTSDFLMAILDVIRSKYSIDVNKELVEADGAQWNTIWNNKGDYIQFLVILFYETCLHALVVKKIIEDGY